MRKGNEYAGWKDEDLEMYVPDVYQPDIYMIDYKKLKERGIKLITFDLDDTIVPKRTGTMPKGAPPLMTKLKRMGFRVMLLSNSGNEKKVQKFAEQLNVESIAGAQKPSSKYFEEIRDRYNMKEEEMAHVGNSIMNDVAGAKSSDITSCLIRYVGKIKHNVIKADKDLKIELKKRGMWDKHHREEKGDQYYQLGEKQKPRVSR